MADSFRAVGGINARRLRPSADFCFGRDHLVEQLRLSLENSAAALLFGGRMSGKTTLLLRFCRLTGGAGDVRVLAPIDIPVYVNLMRLEANAGPAEFWRFLVTRLVETCQERIAGFVDPVGSGSTKSNGSLARLESDIRKIQAAVGEVVPRIIFLIDEAKRLFDPRMPRGVQDNLFALLFGADSEIAGDISMIFAGSQDLYEFSVDSTSPIGSRASRHFISNLDQDSVEAVLRTSASSVRAEELSALAQLVANATGGQAAMTRWAAIQGEITGAFGTLEHADETIRQTLAEKVPLIHIWNSSFSAAACVVRDRLTETRRLSLVEAADLLESTGAQRSLADRAFEELAFTGVAARDGHNLTAVNDVYWSYQSLFASSESPEPNTDTIWKLIEQTEIELRELVFRKYRTRWPDNWQARMEKTLGASAWGKIVDHYNKSAKQYPLAGARPVRDIVGCMYMGQLLILMIAGDAWLLFRSIFRDKRQAEDLFGAIIPVRNDRAHFTSVPEKELLRCRLACDDLLVAMQQADEAE